MSDALPQVTHVYQNHLLDSTHWRHFVPRDDDIVISTSIKAGTTWTQTILAHLVLGTRSISRLWELSPWLDRRRQAIDEVIARLDAQQHRRFIKSHLPLDGLPFHPRVKYLVVARDARDVFMSLFNHHTSYTDAFVAELNALPGRVGPPLPPPQQEIHAFWRAWITTGWFPWESEGYPYWGNLHHTATWWPYRHRDNILLVHYSDLLRDLPGEIRRIAQFLSIPCSDQTIAAVAEAVTFAAMQQQADQLLPDSDETWHGGGQTFVFKGTNGRWKDVLSPEELALHTQAVARLLPPDCAAWLEHGHASLS
jgi:aryl sulfotransferase